MGGRLWWWLSSGGVDRATPVGVSGLCPLLQPYLVHMTYHVTLSHDLTVALHVRIQNQQYHLTSARIHIILVGLP
jgi:hypothetical protein